MSDILPASSSGAASDQGAAFGLIDYGIGVAEPRDFWQLMKPRVMSLVVFTAFIGLVAAPGSMHPFLALASILCIALGAGASGALNMWYDADIDAEMTRTKRRPVPQGKITPQGALAFGSSMSVLSVIGLYFAANIVAAALLAMTIAFYLFIYTMWLKRSTPQNIVIGGAAGAFPPMVGWAAATGDVTLNSIALFLIIFLWTPPHFWALALYKTMDYGRVNVPMMPNVRGAQSTRAQMLAYAVVLAVVCFVPVATGLAGPLYGFVAVILNAGFLALTFKVWRSRAGETADPADEVSLYAVRSGDKVARNLFAFSILYLFALFGALGADIALQTFS